MDYLTVFDASEKGLDWMSPVIGTVFFVAGLRPLLRPEAMPPELSWRRAGSALLALFGLVIAIVIPAGHWRERSALIGTLRGGAAEVVEGPVREFVPMPWSGHARECFTVQDRRFCYSDYMVTAGFNNTSSHGGPIREGLQVRVHHVDCVIARLEIAKGHTVR